MRVSIPFLYLQAFASARNGAIIKADGKADLIHPSELTTRYHDHDTVSVWHGNKMVGTINLTYRFTG